MTETITEITENFLLFDGWEERYKYLIDLGKKLPVMPDALKIDAHLVKGCTSRVWMVPNFSSDPQKGDGERLFTFLADSDALIVKGLIYLLYAAYDGKRVDELKTINIDSYFNKIGLSEHLSPNRRSGFYSMVNKIQAYS